MLEAVAVVTILELVLQAVVLVVEVMELLDLLLVLEEIQLQELQTQAVEAEVLMDIMVQLLVFKELLAVQALLFYLFQPFYTQAQLLEALQ
jgi:hypothetical protein